MSEGFARVDEVAFVRRPPEDRDAAAILFWCDGVLRAPAPASPDRVTVLPGRRETLERCLREGWTLLALSWHPEVSAGRHTADEVEAVFARTQELLGVPIGHAYCPHPDGPPVCWCRKPLPGLGLALMRSHGADPARSLYVGRDASDRTFARAGPRSSATPGNSLPARRLPHHGPADRLAGPVGRGRTPREDP